MNKNKIDQEHRKSDAKQGNQIFSNLRKRFIILVMTIEVLVLPVLPFIQNDNPINFSINVSIDSQVNNIN